MYMHVPTYTYIRVTYIYVCVYLYRMYIPASVLPVYVYMYDCRFPNICVYLVKTTVIHLEGTGWRLPNERDRHIGWLPAVFCCFQVCCAATCCCCGRRGVAAAGAAAAAAAGLAASSRSSSSSSGGAAAGGSDEQQQQQRHVWHASCRGVSVCEPPQCSCSSPGSFAASYLFLLLAASFPISSVPPSPMVSRPWVAFM